MRHATAVLAIGLALTAVLAGCALAWGATPIRPWSTEEVLYPAGTVLKVPGFTVATFEISAYGGVLVGAAVVDHESIWVEALPAGGILVCPYFPGYEGTPWSYAINQTLTAGQEYVWGAVCGGFANITVTQPIELLYP
jgi:hypothetical protein